MFSYGLQQKFKKQRENRAAENVSSTTNFHVARKMKTRERAAKNRLAHAKSRLICIYICGGTLIILGVVFTILGTTTSKTMPNPFLIIGISCIIVGVCVSLLSIEIIIKKKQAEDEESPSSVRKKGASKAEWSNRIPQEDETSDSKSVPSSKPNIFSKKVHPATATTTLIASESKETDDTVDDNEHPKPVETPPETPPPPEVAETM